MSKEKLTVEKFLESKGLPLSNVVFIAFVDGFQRLPDYLILMEEYAELKIKECKSDECY